MKKNIAILGSTGSIGKNLLRIIENDKSKFNISFLSAHKNYKELFKQAKNFKVTNLIISDLDTFNLVIQNKKFSKYTIYNTFDIFDKIISKKLDYTMSCITGIEGLKPTFNIIKFTKKIAIANKESIICGWNLLEKELKKYNTKFIPVDSEHFSIWFGMKGTTNKIDKIYLTASGGPLLNINKKKIKNIPPSVVLKHPTWNMGKKITVDSATLMNKVFEVIEAKNLFNLSYKQLEIIIHPNSYIHAIIKFSNGLIKIIAHDTTMKIPIGNTLYEDSFTVKNNFKIKKFNDLYFLEADKEKYPLLNIISKIPKNISLFETVLVSANDALVNLFLIKKINYIDIQNTLIKIMKDRKFNKFKHLKPKNISQIIKLDRFIKNIIEVKY